MVRPRCINRPCSSRGRDSVTLNGLSSRQEESHACGQGRFTAQLFIEVESDLLLGVFFSQGRVSTLPHLIPGLLGSSLQLQVLHMETQLLVGKPDLEGLGDDEEDCFWYSGE